MVTLWAQTVTALLNSGMGWARRCPITGERSVQEWPVAIRSASLFTVKGSGPGSAS